MICDVCKCGIGEAAHVRLSIQGEWGVNQEMICLFDLCCVCGGWLAGRDIGYWGKSVGEKVGEPKGWFRDALWAAIKKAKTEWADKVGLPASWRKVYL